MFLGWKMDICVPEVVAVVIAALMRDITHGSKGQKIIDWPDCNTLMEVRGFLGICGVVRIWVKDFARCASPLFS